MNNQLEDHDENFVPSIQENADVNTDSDQKKQLFLKCPLKYLYSKRDAVDKGEANIELYTESLIILPYNGDILTFSLREINNVLIKDYQIVLQTISGENLTLYHIGFNFENSARILNQLYSEILLKDLLFQESLKQPAYKAEFRLEQDNGTLMIEGACGIRLYETSLVIIPEFERPLRFPYSDITNFQDIDYTVTVYTDFGERIRLKKLGTQYSPFIRDLGSAINELTQKTQDSIRGLWPDFDQSLIREIAQRIPEGKAARCSDLKALSPEVWPKLQESIISSGIGKEYEFLTGLTLPDQFFIGLKRGLMGDLTGTYLWLLVPLYGLNSDEFGNAIAMEAVTVNTESTDLVTDTQSQGKATYFFRMIDRREYQGLNSPESLQTLSDELIRKICRCLHAVNFRREPIYLSDDSLRTPRYLKYLYAMQSIPGLQELRELYIGRVIHKSTEQWQEDVCDLLKFNTSISDNTLKWSKNKTD